MGACAGREGLAALATLAAVMLPSCGPPCKDKPGEECLSSGWPREDADMVAVRATTPAGGVEYDLVTNSVDWDEYNATDWVKLKVPGEGTLTVDYNWDNGRCKCSLVVTGELGEKLDGTMNRGKRSTLTVPTKVGGEYFVRFHAEAPGQKSVYSAKFTWERAVAVAPPPPPPPSTGAATAEPATHKPGTGKARPPPPPPPPPEDLGKIVKVIPGTEGGDLTVITINRGTEDGVKVGMTGSLVDVPGARFKVKTAYAHSCEAQVKGAAADKIRGKVVFSK
jgi:hypothetical protein